MFYSIFSLFQKEMTCITIRSGTWHIRFSVHRAKPCFQSIPSQRVPLKEVCCLCRISGSGCSAICGVLKSLVYHFNKPSSSRRRSGESPQTIIEDITCNKSYHHIHIYDLSGHHPSHNCIFIPRAGRPYGFYIDSPLWVKRLIFNASPLGLGNCTAGRR